MVISLEIAKRDIHSFLRNKTVYLLLFLFSIILSYTYLRGMFVLDNLSIAPQNNYQVYFHRLVLGLISILNVAFVFFIPVFAIKLITEQVRDGGFNLLLTSPIRVRDIVIGKYLAMTFMVLALLACALVYPLASLFFVDVDLNLLFSSFLGIFLMSLVYMSISLFFSTLTTSVVINSILSVCTILLILLLGDLVYVSNNQVLSEVFNYISIVRHYNYFMVGLLKMKSVFFMLSIAALFSILTARAVYALKGRL